MGTNKIKANKREIVNWPLRYAMRKESECMGEWRKECLSVLCIQKRIKGTKSCHKDIIKAMRIELAHKQPSCVKQLDKEGAGRKYRDLSTRRLRKRTTKF